MPTWGNVSWDVLSDGDGQAQAQAGVVQRETVIRVSHPGEEISAQEITDALQNGGEPDNCPHRARVGLPLNHYVPGSHGSGAWMQSDPPMADYVPTDTASAMCLNGPMIVNAIQVDAYPGSTRCHTIRIVSSGFGPISNDTTGDPTGQQIDAPLVTVTATGKGVTTAAWRADPCAAATPAVPCPTIPETIPATPGDPFTGWSAVDIGGKPVDYNTQPQPVSRDQVAFEFSVLRRGPYREWSEYGAGSTDGSTEMVAPYTGFNIATLQSALNHRNRTTFAGIAVGTLMLLETKVVKVHHSYCRVTFSLLYDEWRHARQRPKAVLSDSIEAAKTIDTTSLISNLTSVFWFQQFLGSIDMDLWFNAAELEIIEEWGKT